MLKVTLIVNGKPVTNDVAVSTLKAFEMPRRNPNEPLRDYAQRVLEKQEEASHAKAQAIADAINKTFNFAEARRESWCRVHHREESDGQGGRGQCAKP